MINKERTYQVIIAGGGPVGLFLGICLEKAGISCVVLEKRSRPITHSRSVGIHPACLELFEKYNLAKSFVNKGIKIKKGIALTENHELGTISFAREPGPFNFILSVPQFYTEQILVKKLTEKNTGILQRNTEILDVVEESNFVTAVCQSGNKRHELKGEFLVGCDGKNSTVRQSAGITFEGSRYPDTYIMGDFSDNTIFGNDAAVFLPAEGVVESFPMPDNMRRWVAKTDSFIPETDRKMVENIIAKRLGHDLSDELNTMVSSFGTQKLIARAFARRRIALAGDAAHIVSPIGGQGMNLGWLDAWHLSKVLNSILYENGNREELFAEYSQKQRKITKKVIRRSELNMKLGRKRKMPYFRNLLIRALLNTPARKLVRKLFTMQKLYTWPV